MAPAWFTVGLSAASFVALVVAFITGIGVAVLSATVAAARAGRIRPTEALREAAVDRPGVPRVRTLLGLAALACGLVMVLAIPLADPAGAVDLKNVVQSALLLVAAAGLLTPVLLPPMVRFLTWPFAVGTRASGLLVRQNSLTAGRRASAVIAPVLITVGLAASILGAAGTADAAKDRDLRRQAAKADYVVLPGAGTGLNRTVIDRVEAIRGLDTTTIATTTLFAREPAISILHFEAPMPIPFSAEAVDRSTLLTFPAIEGSLAGLNDQSVAVDRSWHKHVGDVMRLWLADGTPVTLRVAAVLDAGLGDRLVVTGGNAGRALPDRVHVRLRPGADRAAALTALRAATYGTGARTVPTARWTAAVGDRQQRQTELGLVVLLGVAIAYSALAIATTSLTSISGRDREFTVLRLSGATRRQVLSMVTGESLLLVTTGVALAAAVSALLLAAMGLALGRLVGSPVLVVPWSALGMIAGGSTLIALLASVVTAGLRLRRRVATGAGD
ncbi:FtsX-like permease family protein [Actinoallomurus purpureus]|uniref:FtsX-like permease family protein n=1 Tax=Actinoallomurus purpureus TaxID=478114 RepID=UPI0020925F5E|nr:ABC transporter permease [Actinoallomurus purpureus]